MSVAEEELLAGDYELDRALHYARGDHSDRHVRPQTTFAAERAADELRRHVDVLLRNAEHLREGLLSAEDVLRRVVEREVIAVPRSDHRMRLERIVMFVRSAINLIDLHGRGGESGVGVALLEEALRAIDSLIAELLHVDARRRFVVSYLDELRASRGVLQGVSDDHRDSLADV